MKTILSAEEQLTQLRTYLATSEPFKHCRGKLGGPWLGTGILTESVSGPGSPNNVVKTLNWRLGQARILLNHLAILHRDGHDAAYQELLLALNDKRFVITGEVLPLDKRMNGVLLMYEPKRVLDITRWIQLINPLVMDNHLGNPDLSEQWQFKGGHLIDRPSLKWLTDRVLGANPRLRKCFNDFYASARDNFYRHNFFPSSLFDERVGDFDKWFVSDEDKWKMRNQVTWVRPAPDERSRDCDFLCNWGVACFIPDATQAEVLSRIKRELQDQVATWQFNYPSHITHLSGYSLSIGLFPEKEKGRFEKKWPAYTSGSLSNGLGAVMLENRNNLPMDDPMFNTKEFRQSSEDPDLEKFGIRLHFPMYS